MNLEVVPAAEDVFAEAGVVFLIAVFLTFLGFVWVGPAVMLGDYFVALDTCATSHAVLASHVT